MDPRALGAFSLATLSMLVGCAAPSESAESPAAAELRIDDLVATVEIAHEKFAALAAAMPESTLAWRPMEGVRSVTDVYVHVAADNYFVPALLGVEAPAETGITDDYATFQAYHEREMTGPEMVAAVDASFEHFLAAMRATADELDREVVLGEPTTVGDVWIRAATHLHEHLGQGIAYARSNEVVPPWSR